MHHHHLILSRRTGETIIIDCSALSGNTLDSNHSTLLTLAVHGIRSGQVKLGFHAPEAIKIWRQEIWQRLS